LLLSLMYCLLFIDALFFIFIFDLFLHSQLKHSSVIGSKFIRCADMQVQNYSCLAALALFGFRADECVGTLMRCVYCVVISLCSPHWLQVTYLMFHSHPVYMTVHCNMNFSLIKLIETWIGCSYVIFTR